MLYSSRFVTTEEHTNLPEVSKVLRLTVAPALTAMPFADVLRRVLFTLDLLERITLLCNVKGLREVVTQHDAYFAIAIGPRTLGAVRLSLDLAVAQIQVAVDRTHRVAYVHDGYDDAAGTW